MCVSSPTAIAASLAALLISAISAVAQAGASALPGTNGLNPNLLPTVPFMAAQPDDECAGARLLVLGRNTGFTNVGYTPSPPSFPCALVGAPVNDRWWTFTAHCTASHMFSTCTSTSAIGDTILQVLDNCQGLLSLGCNDDSCGLRSSLTVNLTAGHTYLVRCGCRNNQPATFDINIVTGTTPGVSVLHTSSTCAGGRTLSITGDLNIGGAVTFTMSGYSGMPVVGHGWLPNAPMPCGCLTITDGTGILGTQTTFMYWTGTILVPCNPLLLGVTGVAQGFDIFIAPQPCGLSGLGIYATDIYAVTLGG